MIPQYKSAWRKAPFSMAMATVFGIGHIPGGPGTYAAIVATPLLVLLSQHVGFWWRLAILVALTVVGCVWSDIAEDALQEKDSRRIVLDEVIGVFWTLVWWSSLSWSAAIFGLIVFRVLDMWKPYPIPIFEKSFQGGTGIVIDDVVAGLMGAVLLWGFISLV